MLEQSVRTPPDPTSIVKIPSSALAGSAQRPGIRGGIFQRTQNTIYSVGETTRTRANYPPTPNPSTVQDTYRAYFARMKDHESGSTSHRTKSTTAVVPATTAGSVSILHWRSATAIPANNDYRGRGDPAHFLKYRIAD